MNAARRAVAANPLGDPPVSFAARCSSSYAFMWRVVYSFYGVELSSFAFYHRFRTLLPHLLYRIIPHKRMVTV